MKCGENMTFAPPTKAPTIPNVIDAILEHIARYRLTVLDALLRLPPLDVVGAFLAPQHSPFECLPVMVRHHSTPSEDAAPVYPV